MLAAVSARTGNNLVKVTVRMLYDNGYVVASPEAVEPLSPVLSVDADEPPPQPASMPAHRALTNVIAKSFFFMVQTLPFLFFSY